MSKIDLKIVQHMANLARLQINESQKADYVQQLSQIINHFDKISATSTEGVEPLITPTQVENFWRDDEVNKTISSEDIVKGAPSKQGSLFKVPPVV